MSRLPTALAFCAATLQISQSAAQQVITTPPTQPPPAQMVCTGNVAQATNMIWDSQRIELSFPYARNQQALVLKASSPQLSTTLLIDPDEAFLRGREAKARPYGTGDRFIAISELRISRSTGAFTMAVLLFRSEDAIEGRTLWEGTCSLQGGAALKF